MTLPTFTPGFRLTDGAKLNAMVAAINGAVPLDGLANGSAAAPSLSFTNSATTGIFRSGSNILGFAANGSAVGTVDANGFNGAVGGTTPAAGSFTTVTASGVASFAAGAVGAPSLTFTGDTDTGIYHSGANTMVLVANGAAQATITTTGIQGAIGQTTPALGTFTAVQGTYFTASGYFNNSVGDALTAAGTTRADALALTHQVNNVTTAAASTGVVLPSVATAGVGAIVVVFNAGANAIQVYGAGSDTIDTVAGATGVPLTNAKRCLYIAMAANTWVSAQLGVVSA